MIPSYRTIRICEKWLCRELEHRLRLWWRSMFDTKSYNIQSYSIFKDFKCVKMVLVSHLFFVLVSCSNNTRLAVSHPRSCLQSGCWTLWKVVSENDLQASQQVLHSPWQLSRIVSSTAKWVARHDERHLATWTAFLDSDSRMWRWM